MTYFQFLLAFLLPPIVVLTILVSKSDSLVKPRDIAKWITIIVVIAFTYTTPWDNYLVYKGVWFYGPDRVVGTLGFVPFEEYAFFILQPILTGLWLVLILNKLKLEQRQNAPKLWRTSLVAFWSVCTLLGLLSLSASDQRLTYLGLILSWACPVLAGMCWLSADKFWRHLKAWSLAISVPTAYLWFADRFAIDQGIWDISNQFSLDLDPFGLPIEEAIFFLLTNILVVQGLLMFLPLEKAKYAITE